MNKRNKRKIEKNLEKSCYSKKVFSQIKQKAETQMDINPDFYSKLSNERLYKLLKDTSLVDIELECLEKSE